MTSFACIFQIDIILNINFSPSGIVRSILGLSSCSFGLAPHCCSKGSIFLPIAESTVVKLGLWRCSSCLRPLHRSVPSSGRALQCGQWEPAGCLCDPVPAPTHPGLWLGPLARNHMASLCASLQLGAPHCRARAAARGRRGRWSVKYCAFIFTQCS